MRLRSLCAAFAFSMSIAAVHAGESSSWLAGYVSTVAGIVVGVLFINSDISGGASSGKSAQSVLEKAYNNALYPKP